MKLMKRIFILFVITMLLCSCTKKSTYENVEHISLAEKIGVRSDFNSKIDEFINNNSSYSLVVTGININAGYGRRYSLYEESGVNDINYPNFTSIGEFSIYFDGNSDESNIVDLLYSFPLVYEDSENNLEVTYNLYKVLVKCVLSSSSDEILDTAFDYFNLTTFEDFKNIYNGDTKYNYGIIDLQENYLSTIFLTNEKRFTLEYHDSSFEEQIDN